MYMKINEDNYRDLIDEIKSACESKNYPLPSIFKNHNLSEEYIFPDEATNALDANNEKVIMDNLSEFYKGKTVLIAAHRLSTVRNADNIIVLDKGHIIEQGTHQQLTNKRGAYYKLIRNQLELGN